ncbi:MAG: putative mycofactocin radical SAM maturase MftC [Dehalococcoidia bacterium]|nr:putative mycofactocin radical SAM maturase MftC [Bacillota bacterium]
MKWGKHSQKLEISFKTLYELVVPLEESGRTDDLREVWQFDPASFSSRYRKVFCEAGWTDLCISAGGSVYGCVPAINSSFVAGDLNNASLREIWTESKILNWFREIVPQVVGQREPCCDCVCCPICAGGCRISALYLTGDRMAPDPRCPLVRRYNEKRRSTYNFRREIAHDEKES